ncbi:sialate O-acetylesterase [Chryseosolibacter indicus]|uniref:Beta galactosidase jelly roll domain-containing protein n=1 Tax=Chryseosolibacter indicus TaxID=2782351 RepID=A0ABS5VQS4_9BACT|nr:sialate O-acetylesterase [Chryseosolibacter indicus]MBT1703758.1 beta galactosidase jelly roll domain-containing protein [Chryseosolibacter indicus]
MQRVVKYVLIQMIVIAVSFFQDSRAEVRLPRLISDGLVLQRDTKIKIWGWADVGEEVAVSFLNKHFKTKAGADGKWTVELPAMKAGGPYEMEIKASNHIVVKDILIGDVWICSGQSNMALSMERVKERYPDVIAQSQNPNIRHFFIATNYDFKNVHDDLPSGGWKYADPTNVLSFSATAYFFAKALYEQYHIPIGLINSSVGGTPAEAWLSKDGLKMFPEYAKEANRFENNKLIDSILSAERTLSKGWYNRLYQTDEGYRGDKRWYDINYNSSQWDTMSIPGYWHDKGLKDLNGVVWFRKDFEVPESLAGKTVKLFLGCIVDSDSVYVNGVFVGTTGYRYPPRRYTIPEGILKAGKNTIVIRVINTGGKGGFVEDKKYEISSGAETIDLSGAWHYKVGAKLEPLKPATFIQYKPGALFNSMIAPLLNYSIKGVIWYQGESNTARPEKYNKVFSAMIADWRTHWKQGNFPFLYVQLTNFQTENPLKSGWPELREAQLKTLSVPNTAMAVTIDVGEWNDLHPLNKQDVGKRLALAARAKAYGENIVYSGPIYDSKRIQGNKMVLEFKHKGSGLIAKDSDVLKGFVIAGSDGQFVDADAKIEGNKVIVSGKSVNNPVAVRYAWGDNPAGANLYNKEGLPASPFRTDSN